MRTHEEFQKQMQDAHDCEKCHGKIFCIRCDFVGNRYCSYCGEQVDYPRPTREEIMSWMAGANLKIESETK